MLALTSANLVFWLGMMSPLILVCLVFLVVSFAEHKHQQELPESPLANGAAKPLELADR